MWMPTTFINTEKKYYNLYMKNALYSVGFKAKLYNNTSLQRHIYTEEIKKYIFCLCDFYWNILIHSEIENIFFILSFLSSCWGNWKASAVLIPRENTRHVWLHDSKRTTYYANMHNKPTVLKYANYA